MFSASLFYVYLFLSIGLLGASLASVVNAVRDRWALAGKLGRLGGVGGLLALGIMSGLSFALAIAGVEFSSEPTSGAGHLGKATSDLIESTSPILLAIFIGTITYTIARIVEWRASRRAHAPR